MHRPGETPNAAEKDDIAANSSTQCCNVLSDMNAAHSCCCAVLFSILLYTGGFTASPEGTVAPQLSDREPSV